MEEILVVTKRLLVREELHITKRQTETHKPQTVRRRREVVHVERLPITDTDNLDAETEAFTRDDPDKTQPRPSSAEDPTETRPGLSNR
jgi:stress response protein YsnF